nr:hypothetical protein H12C20.4 - Caenorhabditis elegans [Caenorhabditis elegans]
MTEAFNYTNKSPEKTAFNTIGFFRSVSNIIILTISFLINFLPTTLLGNSLYSPVVESWLINISNTLYLGNEYQIVLIALNRFCAVFFPFKYSQIFSVSNTTVVLFFIYIYRILRRICELLPLSAVGCYALYSPKDLAWNFDPSSHCEWFGGALEEITYTFIVTSVLNIITLAKIIYFYGRRTSNADKDLKKRMRKNTINFLQTIFPDSLYLIDMSFTFKISSWSTHRIWTYISGALIWECLHAFDGFVMVMFHDQVSIFKREKINVSGNAIFQSSRQKIKISVPLN